MTAVVYIFPNIGSKKYEDMARRFAATYCEHPPGETDHEIYVVVNGRGKITPQQEALFEPLVPKFIFHNNIGRDIGAYFMAAQTVPCDFMVCMGAPTRPRLAVWLDALLRACENNGPGIYAPWGGHAPRTHLRTTLFSITTGLLNAYPHIITDDRRYAFEHGPDNIALWCLKQGFSAMQVTTRGVFPVEQWHHAGRDESYFEDQHLDAHEPCPR